MLWLWLWLMELFQVEASFEGMVERIYIHVSP